MKEPRPAVVHANRWRETFGEISAPVPSAFAALILSPIVEVMIVLLAIIHEGLQQVESWGPR